ncbi:hypothetical protein BSG1_05040 [Bacillus sp. SG-1]|nr:hypothetical protein BSG1_05040 [Bacillus sp. SG-1]
MTYIYQKARELYEKEAKQYEKRIPEKRAYFKKQKRKFLK